MSSATDTLSRRHGLTVHDFHRMGQVGILHEDCRVELIEGDIIDMTPIGSRHAGEVNALSRLLNRVVGGDAIVSTQNPVILGEHSEPQPDIALLRPRDDLYRRAHPKPNDVLLIIEVADSSIHHDRDVKVPLYAQYGIVEVWLFDLEARALHVHRAPIGRSYQNVVRHEAGPKITPQALPGLELDLSDLF